MDTASSTASANQTKDTGQLAKVIGCDMEKIWVIRMFIPELWKIDKSSTDSI